MQLRCAALIAKALASIADRSVVPDLSSQEVCSILFLLTKWVGAMDRYDRLPKKMV